MEKLNLNFEKHQEKLLTLLEKIQIGKAVYSKKLAIIYNPRAGKRKNIKDLIEKRLGAASIKFEILESMKYLEPWELA